MKKIITLILCIILTVSLCACADKKESSKETENAQTSALTAQEPAGIESADEIIGSWTVSLSVENAISIFGYSLSDLFGSYTAEEVGCSETLELVLNLDKDGVGSLVLTGEETDTFFVDFYTSFYSYLADYAVATEHYGMTEAELDSNAFDKYGVSSWPEAMEKEIEAVTAQPAENPSQDSISELTYTIANGKLTLTYTADSTVEVYELREDKLVCIQSDNTSGDPSIYTYTRIG